MQRRTFLIAGSALAAAGPLAFAEDKKRRVAVIGHTGRGDYGHGLDTVWKQIPGAEIVAVADADEAGLKKAQAKLGVERGYADYRTMLAEARPEFVSICPRHAYQHHDMALAVIEAGAKGLYIEKPFCRTPAEADSLLAACKQHGAKIAVAHRNQYHPALAHVERLIEDGKLGRILEYRGRGKGDRRGGGEDFWVLGSHIVDLIRRFAGDAVSCSAILLQDGKPVTGADVKEGAEGLGPLAANELHARYQTESGVVAYYDSIANDRTSDAYSLQIVGSEGLVAIHIDRNPVAHFIPGSPFAPPAEPRPWIPITTAGVGEPETQPELIASVANHVVAVRDLVAAVDEDRQPLCSAADGAATVEMICGAFESHRQGGASVSFPLKQRDNALGLLKNPG
ncbi:MAG TPA: Gfo/Idh/MocA family oxidoreductase [Pirellulaceae bacterium]|jgi:predicted dehydrogenase|nr:Gfo/Idh/MocA family oxidoreductase [Pirellulaceae bacterium]